MYECSSQRVVVVPRKRGPCCEGVCGLTSLAHQQADLARSVGRSSPPHLILKPMLHGPFKAQRSSRSHGGRGGRIRPTPDIGCFFTVNRAARQGLTALCILYFTPPAFHVFVIFASMKKRLKYHKRHPI